ncbi:MAG: GDSL-type esterase/lipase family protein [Tannerella sp.]|jgi:lysophospholipase L1-like esterase|nr:GDSL-type esterase/lipase family protein [Tannerella sp.]
MKTINCLLISLLFSLPLGAQNDGGKKPLYVVYIGNSITQGAQLDSRQAPPVHASHYLSEQSAIDLRGFSNQGVSGLTTVDFLPAQNTFFPKVAAAAAQFAGDRQAKLVFSVMLGTNDSAVKGPNGSPVSPVQYFTNLKTIMDELFRLYPEAIFVLHRPIWYSPNTYNGAMYLKAGLERLISYTPELEQLVETYAATRPNQVFPGDAEAFEYFKANHATELIPEEGNAGTFYLHPNASGAVRLGEFWGKAIQRAVTGI